MAPPFPKFRALAVLAVAFLAVQGTPAQQARYPSAADTDPAAMGWMRGFPPGPDRVIGQPDSNYFSFPKLRWTVCHFRELLPTKQVSRGPGAPAPLARDLDPAIDELTFTPLGSDRPMSWAESLAANYTDEKAGYRVPRVSAVSTESRFRVRCATVTSF